MFSVPWTHPSLADLDFASLLPFFFFPQKNNAIAQGRTDRVKV